MPTLEFANWLQQQLNHRNWNQVELARRADISTAGISKIMSGDRKLGIDSLMGIARALNVSTDEVLRQAGLLPMPASATTDERRSVQDLHKKIDKLNQTDRRIIADMVNRMAPE